VASILEELIGDIERLTAEQIASTVSKAANAEKLSAKQVADYEYSLKQRNQKALAKENLKLTKERLDAEAQFAETLMERQAAAEQKIALELQEQQEAAQQKLLELTAQLANRQASAENAQTQAQIRRTEEQIERQTNLLQNNIKTLATMGKNAIDAVGKGVNDYIASYSKYFSDIETRLLGTGRTFDSVKGILNDAIGMNPNVKQIEVLDRIDQFLIRGITRDTELRAALDVLSSKIAPSFEADNDTLVELTRLLQRDTTAARLGMESALMQSLNSQFSDTSYLATGIRDSVSESIYQAIAQMTAEVGTEMEYAIHKWFGAFSAVGVSDATIKQIAQGVGYLGSGDISSLASNQQLLNLFASAASNSNTELGTMLMNGLSARDINSLMQGLYNQAIKIGTSGNAVTRNQYASMFGMSVSDLVGFGNIDKKTLAELTSDAMTYSEMVDQTNRELKNIGSRTPISEQIENIFDNLFSEIGEGIASNPAMGVLWRVADFVEKSGGIQLPSVFMAGSGVSLPNVEALMKNGLLMTSGIASMGKIFSGLAATFNGIDLARFGGGTPNMISNVVSQAIAENARRTSSGGTYVGGDTSESAILQGSVAQAKEMTSLMGIETTETVTKADFDKQTGLLQNIVDSLTVYGIKVRSDNMSITNDSPANKWG
jgi:hypothetical protein